MLRFYSWVNDSHVVYEALAELEEFRHDIYEKCTLARKLIPHESIFTPIWDPETGVDELLMALNDTDPVDAASDKKLLPPSKWKGSSSDFQFEKDLLVPDSTAYINGKFTKDLDLTYTEADVKHLFSYKKKDYKKFCKIFNKILQAKQSDDKAEVKA